MVVRVCGELVGSIRWCGGESGGVETIEKQGLV